MNRRCTTGTLWGGCRWSECKPSPPTAHLLATRPATHLRCEYHKLCAGEDRAEGAKAAGGPKRRHQPAAPQAGAQRAQQQRAAQATAQPVKQRPARQGA